MPSAASPARRPSTPTPGQPGRLRSEVLSSSEVVAQSVAGMAPSAAMAVNVLLVYVAGARGGTWLSTVIALVIMGLVAHAIVVFAKRMTSAGSFYTWVGEGLGPGAGHAAGWGLVLGYIATGMATVIGFALYGSSLIAYLGGPSSSPALEAVLMAVCFAVAVLVAVHDIKLSARTALALESISVTIIVVLCVAAYIHHGSVIDRAQLHLGGASFGGVINGTVLAVFSFVGFESAASLGLEARNPLRSVARAVTWSVGGVGLFYVIVSYSQVLGFAGSRPGFAQVQAPLPDLARLVGLPMFVPVIDVGVTISMFACTLACINASARILYTMAQRGVAPERLSRTHAEHSTPAAAIVVTAVGMLLVPVIFIMANRPLLTVDGWVGTLATFGFMLAYGLVAVAAPALLRREGHASITSSVIGGTAALAMMFVFWVNWLPQLPKNHIFSALSWPYNILPYIFFGWTAVGIASYLASRRRSTALAAVHPSTNLVVRAAPQGISGP